MLLPVYNKKKTGEKNRVILVLNFNGDLLLLLLLLLPGVYADVRNIFKLAGRGGTSWA